MQVENIDIKKLLLVTFVTMLFVVAIIGSLQPNYAINKVQKNEMKVKSELIKLDKQIMIENKKIAIYNKGKPQHKRVYMTKNKKKLITKSKIIYSKLPSYSQYKVRYQMQNYGIYDCLSEVYYGM